MKHASIGAVTCVLGIVMSVPGLILSVGYWIVAGLLVRTFATRWAEEDKRAAALGQDPAKPPEAEGEAAAKPAGKTLVRGAVVYLAIGVPSLAIGLFEIGFEEADSGWRFVPIAIGGLAVGFFLAGLLLTG